MQGLFKNRRQTILDLSVHRRQFCLPLSHAPLQTIRQIPIQVLNQASDATSYRPTASRKSRASAARSWIGDDPSYMYTKYEWARVCSPFQVKLTSSVLHTSAPCWTSHLANTTYPPIIARCNGVWPNYVASEHHDVTVKLLCWCTVSVASKLAPCWTSSLAKARLPRSQTEWSEVRNARGPPCSNE